MATAGYSLNPISKKLGYKAGFQVFLMNAPSHYAELISDISDQVYFSSKLKKELNMIHFFTNSLKELEQQLPQLRSSITLAGMIWVSWYKKASKKPTEITEDLVRKTALALGLVDVKVCAIDDDWSALKLVIPIKDR